MPTFVSAWLCIGSAYALDGPSNDRNTSSKHDQYSGTSSNQGANSTHNEEAQDSGVGVTKETTSKEQVATPNQSETSVNEGVTKEVTSGAPDTGQQVLEVAGAPLKAIGSVVDSTREAIRAYLAGNKTDALKSLSVAADQGHAPAQWKLARMYADGDGVPRDDLRAFENFSQMCDRHADEAPDSTVAPFVSSAFVALGSYYLNGIPNSAVKPNPARAREMFAYSASYFGDPSAQFVLARLYLDGIGGPKDARQAVRWLNLSAEKGHRLAQAELGKLLFSGEAGPKQRARGLMWLKLASESADPSSEAWIIETNNAAVSQASDTDILAANAYLLQHNRTAK